MPLTNRYDLQVWFSEIEKNEMRYKCFVPKINLIIREDRVYRVHRSELFLGGLIDLWKVKSLLRESCLYLYSQVKEAIRSFNRLRST